MTRIKHKRVKNVISLILFIAVISSGSNAYTVFTFIKLQAGTLYGVEMAGSWSGAIWHWLAAPLLPGIGVHSHRPLSLHCA